MKKFPHFEFNPEPSQLNTSRPDAGAAGQMQQVAAAEPQYNNLTIDDMRGNPLHERIDKIDKIGKAQKALYDAGQKVSKSKFVRSLNRQMQHPTIKNSKK